MRKQTLFEAAKKYQRKLEALGGMQSHQRDLRPFIVGISIAYQRGMIEKLIEGFTAIFRIHGRVDQFVQVLNPRVSLGSVLCFELLDISSAINQKFQKLRGVRGCARGAKAFDRFFDLTFRNRTRSFNVLSSAEIERRRIKLGHVSGFRTNIQTTWGEPASAVRLGEAPLSLRRIRSLPQPLHIRPC